MRQLSAPLLLLWCALFLGCEETKLQRPLKTAAVPKSSSESSKPLLQHLEPVSELSKEYASPAAEFKKGEVTPLEPDAVTVEKTKNGFVVKMPSSTPIPTPTVINGQLFASGGFSSQTFFCLNSTTGEFVWGAQLSDDGPSTAVTTEDSVIFNTESCTIFALDRKTGKCHWSHYMGDPMMGAPAIAGDRVFTVYPASVENKEMPVQGVHELPDGKQLSAPPTYAVACLSAASGKVLWQQWLDGDCISAPVPVQAEEVLVATLPGTLYRLKANDGKVIGSWKARITSMPVLAKSGLFFTKRADDVTKKEPPHEAVARVDLNQSAIDLLAMRRPAPYLDRIIQQASQQTGAASSFEKSNGIGGGFGGGFFAVQDAAPLGEPAAETDEPKKESPEAQKPLDALGQQQQKAADNLGLGNVSTLQGYQGSRIVNIGVRNVNCMGDEVVCTSTTTGNKLWSVKLAGDLAKSGGHLGAPPVFAEGDLFVATVGGKVLRLRLEDGTVKSEYEIGSEVRYSPVIAEGRLYVSTQNGEIVCLKLGD